MISTIRIQNEKWTVLTALNSSADVELVTDKFEKVKCWRKCFSSTPHHTFSSRLFVRSIIYLRTNVNVFQEKISKRKKANQLIALAEMCKMYVVTREPDWLVTCKRKLFTLTRAIVHSIQQYCQVSNATEASSAQFYIIRSFIILSMIEHKIFDNDAVDLFAVNIMAMRVLTKTKSIRSHNYKLLR